MIQHEATIHLNQPAERVFAFLTDPNKLTQWQSNLVKSERLTEGPWRAGSRFREVRRLRGKEEEIEGKISAFEPNRRLATETFNQPYVTVAYSLQPEDGGTRLSYQFSMHPAGLMRLLKPIILASIRKESQSDLERLKRLLGG